MFPARIFPVQFGIRRVFLSVITVKGIGMCMVMPINFLYKFLDIIVNDIFEKLPVLLQLNFIHIFILRVNKAFLA